MHRITLPKLERVLKMLSIKCAPHFKLLGLLMSKMMWAIWPEWGRRSGLCWPNEEQIYRKVGRAVGRNEF